MVNIKLSRTIRALLVSTWAIVALSLSYGGFASRPMEMSGMERMAHARMSTVRCQSICTSAIRADIPLGSFIRFENDGRNTPGDTLALVVCLALLPLLFVVKRLYAQSSWRPPDRVLLFGRYADSL